MNDSRTDEPPAPRTQFHDCRTLHHHHPLKVHRTQNLYKMTCMRVQVLPMRRRGRRLKHTDWINQPAVDGVLSMAELSTRHGHVKMVSITTVGDGLTTRLLPDLYEPVLTMLGNWILVLRGFERCDGEGGKFSVVREWHCTVRPA